MWTNTEILEKWRDGTLVGVKVKYSSDDGQDYVTSHETRSFNADWMPNVLSETLTQLNADGFDDIQSGPYTPQVAAIAKTPDVLKVATPQDDFMAIYRRAQQQKIANELSAVSQEFADAIQANPDYVGLL